MADASARTALLEAIRSALQKVGIHIGTREAGPCQPDDVLNIPPGVPQIYELEATVTDFNGDQDLLHGRLNALLADLGSLQSQRDGAAFEVPVELLRFVHSSPIRSRLPSLTHPSWLHQREGPGSGCNPASHYI